MTSPARTASVNGFRSQQNAYMAAKALVPVVAKAAGQETSKMAFLVAGLQPMATPFYDSFATFSKEQGWQQVAKEVVPLGTTDYSSASFETSPTVAPDLFRQYRFRRRLPSPRPSRQSSSACFKRMKLVVPNLSSFQDKEAWRRTDAGRSMAVVIFWWGMQDRNPTRPRRSWRRSTTQNKYYPRWGATCRPTCRPISGR